jgi:hypothetical protein
VGDHRSLEPAPPEQPAKYQPRQCIPAEYGRDQPGGRRPGQQEKQRQMTRRE